MRENLTLWISYIVSLFFGKMENFMCRSTHSIHDPYALSHTFSRSLCLLATKTLLLALLLHECEEKGTHPFVFLPWLRCCCWLSFAIQIFPNFHSLSLARAALIADCRVALHPTDLYLFSVIAITFRTSTRWKWSEPCVCDGCTQCCDVCKIFYEFLRKMSEFCWRKRKTSADCKPKRNVLIDVEYIPHCLLAFFPLASNREIYRVSFHFLFRLIIAQLSSSSFPPLDSFVPFLCSDIIYNPFSSACFCLCLLFSVCTALFLREDIKINREMKTSWKANPSSLRQPLLRPLLSNGFVDSTTNDDIELLLRYDSQQRHQKQPLNFFDCVHSNCLSRGAKLFLVFCLYVLLI